MEIIRLTVSPLAVNCYIVYTFRGKGKGKTGLVIDPGGDCDKIIGVARQYNIDVKAIVNTHGHADHIFCNEVLKMAWNCEVWMSQESAEVAADSAKNASADIGMDVVFTGVDKELEDREVIRFGRVGLKVLKLPGHSPGGIGLYSDKGGFIFAGDLIFKQGWGRADMYGGDEKVLMASIKKVLSMFQLSTMVYPGHGEVFTLGEWQKANLAARAYL